MNQQFPRILTGPSGEVASLDQTNNIIRITFDADLFRDTRHTLTASEIRFYESNGNAVPADAVELVDPRTVDVTFLSAPLGAYVVSIGFVPALRSMFNGAPIQPGELPFAAGYYAYAP